MPRVARKRSQSGVYHIMFRGNELKDVFIDDEDRSKFLNTLFEKSENENFSIYAFCLMNNHVHILLSGEHQLLGKLIKRINTSYVFFFNKKYDRKGHLFHDRYKSEPVETGEYLLEAVRYIHNNPVKAGMVKEASDYEWSSYNCYTAVGWKKLWCVNHAHILEMFSMDTVKAQKLFIEFSKRSDSEQFIDVGEDNSKEEKIIKGEPASKQYVEDFLKQKGLMLDCISLRGYEDIRYEIILNLRQKSDLSVRQIAYILGVNRGMVQRVTP